MKKVLIGLGLAILGIIFFIISGTNEILTLFGFAAFLTGSLLLMVLLVSKFIKKLIIRIPVALTAGVLIFILTTVIFLIFFFPNEMVRGVMQKEMSMALGRPVSIGGLRISLLEGISLVNLRIGNRYGRGTFIKAKSFILSYRILPILVGKLVIYKAVLDSPQINIYRYRRYGKAVSNIDDLLAAPAKKTSVPGLTIPYAAPPKKKGMEAPAIPLAIHISELGVKNASLIVNDRATPGFKNSYRLDKLDFIIGDFNWPAFTPLTIRFNFQLSMSEITRRGIKTKKTMNLMPGFEGSITLLAKNGRILPTGSIVFKALKGEFYGQQFLLKSNALLNRLKRNFFGGISKAALSRMNLFERLLKKKIDALSGKSLKKINELVNRTTAELKRANRILTAAKNKILGGFDRKVNQGISDINKKAASLVNSVRGIHSRVTRIYPGAKKAVSLSKYLTRAQRTADSIKRSNQAFSRRLRTDLNRQLLGIIRAQQTRYNKYINNLKSGLNAYIAGAGKTIRAAFLRSLKDANRFTRSFKVNFPFLKKSFNCDDINSTLEFKDGKVFFKKMLIRGKNYKIRADGFYGLTDSSMRLDLKVTADKKFNKNALLSLFADKDGNIVLDLYVKSDGKNMRFGLKGKSIVKRMRVVAIKKAEAFIRNYIGRNVNISAIAKNFSSSRGSAPSSKNDSNKMNSAGRTKANSLQSSIRGKQNTISREKTRIKNDMTKDAKKYLKKKSGGVLKKFGF